jgi:hypothetical protein
VVATTSEGDIDGGAVGTEGSGATCGDSVDDSNGADGDGVDNSGRAGGDGAGC